MENASKALIMAGGILIGILILTLAIYLIVTFGSDAKKTYDKVQQQQLEQFNAQYTSYCGKDGLTIYDVITVANMAKENNNYYDVRSYTEDLYISVILNGIEISSNYQTLIADDINKIKKDGANVNTELPIYECKGIEFNNTGRVKKIIFKSKQS